MRLGLIGLAAAVFALAACAQRPTPTIVYSTQPDLPNFVAGGGGPAESHSGFAEMLGTTDRVFFAFDSAQLDDAAQATIHAWAKALAAHPDVDVVVAGHCDERGSREYNLALGERRAAAVKDLLVALGIKAARIKTISYGKERPAVEGHNEAAWAQNRRAVLTPG